MSKPNIIYQRRPVPGWRDFLFTILIFLLLTGCQVAQAAPEKPVTITPTRSVRDATNTPTSAPSRTPTLTPTITPTPTIQPTAATTPTPTLSPDSVYYPPGPVSVPILMYHNVSDKGNTPFIVRVSEFRAQMRFLYEADYKTVTISELVDIIRNGGYLPEKPVVISFDDGFLGVHDNALPIMEPYEFRGVVYVISGTLETDLAYGYLQTEELDALVEQGWEIGSHSISHSNLKTTKLGIRNEIEGSKKDLETILGIPIRSFAYPYNVANAWIRERVEEYGYDSAVGVDIFNSHLPGRIFFLSRRTVSRGISLAAFRSLLEKEGQ